MTRRAAARARGRGVGAQVRSVLTQVLSLPLESLSVSPCLAYTPCPATYSAFNECVPCVVPVCQCSPGARSGPGPATSGQSRREDPASRGGLLRDVSGSALLGRVIDALSTITALCIAPRTASAPSFGHDALALAEDLGVADVIVSRDNQAALR